MNESTFWKPEVPKDRRIDLVAELLLKSDPNARIPGDEGLRPERVEDFYYVFGFTSLEDFRERLREVERKYRYGEPEKVEETPRVIEEVSVPEVKRTIVPRVRKERSEVPVETSVVELVAEPVAALEQPLREINVPVSEVMSGDVEAESKKLKAKVMRNEMPMVSEGSAPSVPMHPEERVSALARAARAWFGRGRSEEGITPPPAEGEVDEAKMESVITALLSRTLGIKDLGIDQNNRSVQAHVETADRLKRAIATSAHLEPGVRARMVEVLEERRGVYINRTTATQRDLAEEVRADIGVVAERIASEGTRDSALRTLAGQSAPLAEEVEQLRAKVEGIAVQKGGIAAIEEIDKAFRDGWREAWKDDVTMPEGLGALEASLPGLRDLEEHGYDNVRILVVKARESAQKQIDKELAVLAREMKRRVA